MCVAFLIDNVPICIQVYKAKIGNDNKSGEIVGNHKYNDILEYLYNPNTPPQVGA